MTFAARVSKAARKMHWQKLQRKYARQLRQPSTVSRTARRRQESGHEQQQFQNKTFVVEECYFINCVLVECDLFYSGGDSEWVNTSFQNCRGHWRGAAGMTFRLMQLLGMLKEPTTIPADLQKLNSK